MRSFTNGHIKMATTALRANRGRSFLTMLGVIIGVASVITVVGIGEGVKHQVNGQINRLGKDVITIRAKNVNASDNQGLGLLSNLTITTPLPEGDYGTVAATPGVSEAVPFAIAGGQAAGDQAPSGEVVIGTTDQMPDILKQDMAYGVFFSSDEADSNVAVLGERAAIRLFNENVPLGRTVSFRGQQFIVRGVLDTFEATPFSGQVDFNDAVFIPYKVAQDMTSHTAALYEVLAKPNEPKQTDQTVTAVRSRLLKSHGGQEDFSVLKSSQSLAATNAILDLLTRLITGIAAISLLVGGVGIMNVMLVSVTERMREVGIRKAVGATNRQILVQFLIEAAVLSFVGGVIGIIVAGLGNLVIRILSNLQPQFNWRVILLATGVSVAVGILFGSVPAIKAARKEPIEAFRNE